jgi:curved DNA-binding protein CbpA
VAPDYYLILGVTPDATDEEIRAAWRRQVRYWHPDRNADPRAARRVQLLNHAYDVLSDPEQRSRYDGTGARYDDDDPSYDVEYAAAGYATDEPPAPSRPMPAEAAGAGAPNPVSTLLDRLEPLIAEANLLLARSSEPPADVVDRWGAAALALIEQRLGWWHTYAQHLRMALGQGDAHVRLVKAQGVLSTVRSDGLAGNIRPAAAEGR